MIAPSEFVNDLIASGIDFFCGVPDSLLKNLCAYLEDALDTKRHVIAANEGNAVALAAGYHLSTGKTGAVYLQNSGLGNSVNPLASLADPEVYRIPLLLIIGWRGEPGVKDEPQHIKQGRITTGQLDLLEIPYEILDAGSGCSEKIAFVVRETASRRSPAALLVRAGTFEEYKSISR